MKLKSILAIAAIGLTLFSCLKTKDTYGLINDSGSIVSGIFSHYLNDPLIISLNSTPTTETIDLLTVRYYAPRGNQPKSDMQVKLKFNPTLVSDFNAANGTTYADLSTTTGIFTLSDPTMILTMTKGSEGSYTMKITINKNAMNLANTYALGFSIESVSEGVINQIEKSFLFVLGVKNPYDGVYSVKGYALRAGDPALTGYFSGVVRSLITKGPYTVDFDQLQCWGDGQSGVGIGIPRIVVDPATNNITVSSSGGAYNFPGYPNRYVPATKTFYVGFSWGGGPGVREAYDTMTYLRAR